MAKLPEPPSSSKPPYWEHWRHDLWSRAQSEPAESFWNWPCVRHTMTVQHFPIANQLAYLQQDAARWLPLLKDEHPYHARNLIHQAYHLKLWEDTTGQRIEDLKSIYEFGGGYGALADLVGRLGFQGHYAIYDLPEFVLLQRYFLSQRDVSIEHADKPVDCDLFVAIYSISETPIAFRDEFMERLTANSYLLLISSRFAEYDNMAWAAGFRTGRNSQHWVMHQFPGRDDWYSIGWMI
jgi:hypothetical protein